MPEANEIDDQTGDLNINKANGTMTVSGAGARSTIIDATGLGDRVISVQEDTTGAISGVTITGGSSPSNSDGGGIRNDGTLTLTDSTVTDNTSGLSAEGGGIGNPDDSSIALSGDTIANNQSGDHGGGLDITAGSASIANTTITNNHAPSHGGGVDVSTVGAVQFTNDTIYGNTDDAQGGGVGNLGNDVSFVNTIVAGNSAGMAGTADCYQGSPLTDQGHNLDSSGSCFTPSASNGDINANPDVGPLQNNGAQTDTMALLDGSPAINAGSNSACPATDQRGVSRPQPVGGICDIGAYEATPPIVATEAASAVTETSATLNGTVNPDNLSTTYHFEYGTTTAYGTSTSSQSAGSDYAVHAETAGISGLKPGTTYHFRIVASNMVGTSTGTDQTFTTPISTSTPSLTPPLVTTGATETVGATAATLTGSVNPRGSATTYDFVYGTSTKYGKSTTTRSVGSGTKAVSVHFRVTGLRPGAIYHYRLSATSAGGTARGKDRTFQTKAQIAIAGVATSGCMTASSQTVRVRVTSLLGVHTTVRLDGRTIAHGARSLARSLASLRAGAHSLTAIATGRAGTSARTVRFAICPKVTPKFTG